MLISARRQDCPGVFVGSSRLFAVFLSLLFVGGFAPRFAQADAPREKLIVWGLQPGKETAGLDAAVRVFEQRNPDMKVSLLSMGAGAMNPQKLMTSIVGGVPPDVIQPRPLHHWRLG